MEVPFQIELSAPPVCRIAAIIHVYYKEVLPKIVEYLKNIPLQTDLFISTDTTAKKSLILESLKTYSNGTVEVRIFENRGRSQQRIRFIRRVPAKLSELLGCSGKEGAV
jgi:lipopolysaccharide biosynthesis protein